MGDKEHKIDLERVSTLVGIGTSALFVILGVNLSSLAIESLGDILPEFLDENYSATLVERAVLVAIIGIVQGLIIDKAFESRSVDQLKYGTLISYGVFLFFASLVGAQAEFVLATETTLWIWLSSIIATALLSLKNWDMPSIKEGAKYSTVSLLTMMFISAIIRGQLG